MTAATFLIMIAVNAMANILPINGVSTGQVSDAYQNLFAPAGLTFSIWGLIYLLLAGYTLYHVGLFQGGEGAESRGLLRKTGILFSISSLANAAWIFSWHYDFIPLTMLLMVVILVCLILINQAVGSARLSVREKILVRLPFSVYFGWITVATIANATVLLVSLDWKGFGLSEQTWAIIIIAIGMLIGAATAIRNRDIAYGLVIIWAYAGIYIKHTSESGFSGQYPIVIYTVVVCIAALLAALVYIMFSGGRRTGGRRVNSLNFYSTSGSMRVESRPKSKKLLLWAAIIAAAAAGAYFIPRFAGPEPAQEPAYWPTQEWKSSTPEEQGIDSAKLAEGLQTIREKDIDIHSLLIIRNGKVVVDASFYPYDGKTPHNMASVTKSVTTTLAAIAAEQGKLELDQPMVSFFPNVSLVNRDELMDRITVRHLASMTSGLESMGFEQDEGTLKAMMQSEDWMKFALDRKVVSEPGSKFVYDSPGMHLLSGILQSATGMSELEFAKQNLFEPLGIKDVIWQEDPQGYSRGWGDLFMHPRDAAKLGYLWLNKGVWDGEQIVPKEWVESSIKTQVKTGTDDDYGYGWWVMPQEATGPEYAAVGRGGQRVQVIPGLDAIIVTTGGGFEIDDIMPFIVPSLIDPEKPLKANPEGVEKLNAAIAEVVMAPLPEAVPQLPEMARRIAGKTYVFDANPIEIKSFKLEFDDSAEAGIELAFTDGRPAQLQKIGLDGVYRFFNGEYGLPEGMRGYWADGETFVLERDAAAMNDHATYELHFEGKSVTLKGQETAHEFGIQLEGKQD